MRVAKSAKVGLILVALTAFFAGCAGESEAAAGPKSFILKANLNGFTGIGGSIEGVKNPTLKAVVGDSVTLTLRNGEELEHDWSIPALGVATEKIVAEGAQTQTTFTASKKGTFEYYCTVVGHKESGMLGKITIS